MYAAAALPLELMDKSPHLNAFAKMPALCAARRAQPSLECRCSSSCFAAPLRPAASMIDARTHVGNLLGAWPKRDWPHSTVSWRPAKFLRRIINSERADLDVMNSAKSARYEPSASTRA